jgi:hypothetical protein
LNKTVVQHKHKIGDEVYAVPGAIIIGPFKVKRLVIMVEAQDTKLFYHFDGASDLVIESSKVFSTVGGATKAAQRNKRVDNGENSSIQDDVDGA